MYLRLSAFDCVRGQFSDEADDHEGIESRSVARIPVVWFGRSLTTVTSTSRFIGKYRFHLVIGIFEKWILYSTITGLAQLIFELVVCKLEEGMIWNTHCHMSARDNS